jgi:hypothetical protein
MGKAVREQNLLKQAEHRAHLVTAPVVKAPVLGRWSGDAEAETAEDGGHYNGLPAGGSVQMHRGNTWELAPERAADRVAE